MTLFVFVIWTRLEKISGLKQDFIFIDGWKCDFSIYVYVICTFHSKFSECLRNIKTTQHRCSRYIKSFLRQFKEMVT